MADHSVTGDWSQSASPPLAEKPTIPGYEILEEIGRGGMGVVFKARQLALKRLVALKLLRDNSLAGPQERARFQIETEAAARMQHPNVVQIYSAGEHQGRPYFAMELVEGGSLDKYLGGRPQPATYAAQLIRTLASAVQHAHAQNIVHRDLKPANILLTGHSATSADETVVASAPLIADQQPKITDFGLAKRLDTASVAWTQDGAVLGTASYMAPEQAEGRTGDVGPTVDVYALGAVLYEMLTGRPPFRAETWSQTVQQVLHDDPEPPTRQQPNVPQDLETICLKCLEKVADRRYATAEDLADDLGRFLEGKPIAAAALSKRQRLERLAARDGYSIGDEIGRGPRSTVYRAQYGPLHQPIALKVFAAGGCTREEWDAWLHRSADMWAALTHPHVLPVQRAGWWDGAAYVATEYVPSGSLATQLASQRFTLQQALELVQQLTEIVIYIHRQGVAHGNLKPSNVLLAADGIPRLVDFRRTGGLFQNQQPDDEPAPAGLGYLAPELLADAHLDPHPPADIYGIGAILYELLTGRPPFAGNTLRETLEQVRSQDVVPPSRLNSHVTPALESFCLRCLRKNPWRRYSRAYDVLTRLLSFQTNIEGHGGAGKPRTTPRPDRGG